MLKGKKGGVLDECECLPRLRPGNQEQVGSVNTQESLSPYLAASKRVRALDSQIPLSPRYSVVHDKNGTKKKKKKINSGKLLLSLARWFVFFPPPSHTRITGGWRAREREKKILSKERSFVERVIEKLRQPTTGAESTQ